jgi:polyisoprenoid-binding protein YceI
MSDMAPAEQITPIALQELLTDPALARKWDLDPSRSTVSLRNRSMWGLAPVNGVFRQVAGGGAVSHAGDITGEVTVAAASIETKNTRRDTHLRSLDFFDSDNYPDITFTCESIRPSGQVVTVSGILRVRDRTRPLTFDATAAAHADGEVWLDATVRINQTDFGLTWNLLGMVSMNNTITIHAVFTSR